MQKSEIILPVCGFFLATSMLIWGLMFSDYEYAVMKFPVFICTLTIVFTLLVFYQQIATAPSDDRLIVRPGRSSFLLLSAAPLIAIFGVEIGLTFFFFGYMHFHGHGKIKSLGLSMGCFMLIYILFEYYFYVPHFKFLLPWT